VLSNSEIKQIFKEHVPVEVRIPVSRIHRIVESKSNLTDEDREPHPSEIQRGSQYPKWKRRVQAVLHRLKTDGKIKHFEESNEYIFYRSTFV